MKRDEKTISKTIKTIAFIDASNIIYGCRDAGWKVDYQKLIRYLKDKYQVAKTYYYGGVDDTDLMQLKFYEVITKLGYELHLVPMKRFANGKKKADVDSRMTFEIMRYLDEFDRAVIMTGDGDFYWVLEYLVEKKKKVYLFAHRKNTAHELKKLFGPSFTDLSLIRNKIERT